MKRMSELVRKLDSFTAEDGHIESVLVGEENMKVSFLDWKERKIVIIFYDVEEFHGADTSEQSIIGQDIGDFMIRTMENDLYEYCFIGAWDENAFLKIKAKCMEIYDVGVERGVDAALFEMDLSFIGDKFNE